MYLVVDDDVHRAVCSVRRQVAQMESFVDDALASERSITMEENGHHLNVRTRTHNGIEIKVCLFHGEYMVRSGSRKYYKNTT